MATKAQIDQAQKIARSTCTYGPPCESCFQSALQVLLFEELKTENDQARRETLMAEIKRLPELIMICRMNGTGT